VFEDNEQSAYSGKLRLAYDVPWQLLLSP